MQKSILTFAFLYTFIGAGFAQNVKIDTVRTVILTKSIEKISVGRPDKKEEDWTIMDYTLDLERLFWGDQYAQVEYLIIPSFEGASALRILPDPTTNGSILEVKHITNWGEEQDKLYEEFPGISLTSQHMSMIPKETFDLIVKHNNSMIYKRFKKSLNLYKIKTKQIPVNDRFAKQLYSTLKKVIAASEKEKKIPFLMGDGERNILRCVVGDEIWTLNYSYETSDGNIRKISDIYKQIIKDVEAGNLDESKYRKILDKL